MTDRERLAEKLSVITRTLGYGDSKAPVTAESIRRLYPGYWQRGRATWSWATHRPMQMGSTASMARCARGVLILSSASLGINEYDIMPAEPSDKAPVGAVFGVDRDRAGDAIDWYDAEGLRIGEKAP